MYDSAPAFLIDIAPDCMSIPLLPSILTTPEPFGVSAILPFEVDTKALLLTSKSPPSCGELSSTTSVIAPDAANPDTT